MKENEEADTVSWCQEKKVYGDAEMWLYAFLILELHGGKRSDSRPDHFTFKERTLSTH
jgi:hypothetical protein